MLDAALGLLLEDPIEQAVVAEAGVVACQVLEVVQQEEIDIVDLEVLQRGLEHLLAGLQGGAAAHIGNLGRDLVGAAGMAAEGLARHDLGLAVCGSGVKVVDTVGDGVIDHRVDGILVQRLAAAEAASAAALCRQAHTSQTEHAQGLPHLAPGPGVDLGAVRGFLPGSGMKACGGRRV